MKRFNFLAVLVVMAMLVAVPVYAGGGKVIIVPASYKEHVLLVVDVLKKEIPKRTGYEVELILLEGRNADLAWQAALKESVDPAVKERIVVGYSHKDGSWVFYYGDDKEYFVRYCHDDEIPGRVAKVIKVIFPQPVKEAKKGAGKSDN